MSYRQFIYIIILICAPLAVLAVDSPAENAQIIISSVPYIGAPDADISVLIIGGFKLMIGIGLSLAVVRFAIDGIIAWYSAIAENREDVKRGIPVTLFGVVLLGGGWLLLNTINPDLTELRFLTRLRELGAQIAENIPSVSNSGPSPLPGGSGTCSTCIPMPENLHVTSTACRGGACFIDESFAVNLGLLVDRVGIPMVITEAYPPTGYHSNVCHQNGTCVDMDFTSMAIENAQNINHVIDIAIDSGVTACYEVRTPDRRDQLIAQGVYPTNVSVVSWIRGDGDGEHFSVYNGFRTCNS